MLRGVLIGSAAALAVGGGLVAAAVASREPASLPAEIAANSSGPRLKITLTNPKEPVRPPGPKLETVPPGADTAPAWAQYPPPAPILRPPPAPTRPQARDPEPREFARAERNRLEPRRELGDFPDEDEPPAYVEQGPDHGYADPRPPWRERRYERRRSERYERYERYEEPEPYYPEPFPPPWERR